MTMVSYQITFGDVLGLPRSSIIIHDPLKCSIRINRKAGITAFEFFKLGHLGLDLYCDHIKNIRILGTASKDAQVIYERDVKV